MSFLTQKPGKPARSILLTQVLCSNYYVKIPNYINRNITASTPVAFVSPPEDPLF
ncbi:hypothetical protein JCM21714_1709 [Gracilibacillus boraciitolerans JCM 21714]|uniref:Uncharacterized protein n=1 Tax=Gracilibacillus boraciitolerans JCM 21714 TaxID=1298598 RepID=W4VIQ5_9BACI|nr:hypothetical protein JCM21714_1709 [Gracilibacillus boraciitolerans JCM 21714]